MILDLITLELHYAANIVRILFDFWFVFSYVGDYVQQGAALDFIGELQHKEPIVNPLLAL